MRQGEREEGRVELSEGMKEDGREGEGGEDMG